MGNTAHQARGVRLRPRPRRDVDNPQVGRAGLDLSITDAQETLTSETRLSLLRLFTLLHPE